MQPLRVPKSGARGSPTKMNALSAIRPLSELSPMAVRRNSPSFPQGNKVYPTNLTTATEDAKRHRETSSKEIHPHSNLPLHTPIEQAPPVSSGKDAILPRQEDSASRTEVHSIMTLHPYPPSDHRLKISRKPLGSRTAASSRKSKNTNTIHHSQRSSKDH